MKEFRLPTQYLASCLDEAGFPLPQDCREARLIVGVDQVIMIQYDVMLTAENIGKLGRALVKFSEESKSDG